MPYCFSIWWRLPPFCTQFLISFLISMSLRKKFSFLALSFISIFTSNFKGLILFFCKENANERNVSLLTDCRTQLIFWKDTLFFWKMQEILEKCLRVREINRKRCILTCPVYGARRIHLIILWIRIILIDTSRKKITLDAIWIADTNLNMILFSESCIRI